MTTPAALPMTLRVLVKGSSIVNWSSGQGNPRSDLAFPRGLEGELARRGRPSAVLSPSVASERTRTGLRNWEPEILAFSPDVVVLGYGYYESIHLFLPWWFERHANSLRGSGGAVRTRYRSMLLRPVWMTLAKLQAWLDTRLPPTILHRDRRVVADIERIIANATSVSSPLILVLELLPPSSRYAHWFPGMTARIAAMNEALSALVQRLGSADVQVLHVRDIVDEHFAGDLDLAVPDGFHYTPELHRLVAAQLADRIEDWARTQPHLSG